MDFVYVKSGMHFAYRFQSIMRGVSVYTNQLGQAEEQMAQRKAYLVEQRPPPFARIPTRSSHLHFFHPRFS